VDGSSESGEGLECLVGEVVERLPMVLLGIVDGYADDPLERAWVAALSPCARGANMYVRPERNDGTFTCEAPFHHYICGMRTKQEFLIVPELWALAASKAYFGDEKSRKKKLLLFLENVEWKMEGLSLEVADESTRTQYPDAQPLGYHLMIPLRNDPRLGWKETVVTWRAVVSASHHVLFLDRDTHLHVRGLPWLCSSAFEEYAAQELLKALVGVAVEEWTKLC